jgi:hypothetical protein
VALSLSFQKERKVKRKKKKVELTVRFLKKIYIYSASALNSASNNL